MTADLKPAGRRGRRHPVLPAFEELSPGERAADRVRNGMGSWAFVLVALLFLAVWMAVNNTRGFDPYPFILLNLLLSCVAALQGAILLIAAKRSDQVSSDLAHHDYETNLEADARIGQVMDQLTLLQRQHQELKEMMAQLLARPERTQPPGDSSASSAR